MESSGDMSTSAPAPSQVFSAEDDDSLTHGQVMAAGALAGITEHVVIFPIDTIKTRMQSYVAIRHPSRVVPATRAIVASEGVSALWRGVSAVALSAGPAHALYFATYEAMRHSLSQIQLNRRGHASQTTPPVGQTAAINPLATAVAGMCATVVSDGVMTPWDVVKQRMQLSAVAYSTPWQCARSVYSNYGLSAFYAAYKATLLMNIPFTSVYFTTYESTKHMLLSWRNLDHAHYSASSHCIAGAIAGAAAAAVTNPLDVVKTRLQTQGELGARRYRGLSHALSSIRVEEGVNGLMRGVIPRVLFHMPAAAVSWTTYEFCKHMFRNVSSRTEPENPRVDPSAGPWR